ncbi:MAG: hypothetical protein EPO40_33015 [Myxococcaceae bacterium]|nr:MAG: hypothetical protein EPO40_33015 [Myxococcaceae bacterium]
MRAGLEETGRAGIDLRTGASPHLGRLVVHGATAYVANSFDGIAAFQLGAGGRVTLTKEERMAPGVPRCTTIALHPASSTLFCAAADRSGPALGETTSPIAAYRVGGPDVFSLRSPSAVRLEAFVAALHVHGDRLLLATFDHGLLQAPISADGSLGAITALPRSGDAVALAGAGELLAQLDRDAGLRLWRVTPSAIEPEGEAAALDGPPLAVTMDGTTIGVALGSRGAAVYAAATARPTLLTTLHPPCSAVSIALRGDLAAVGCMDGLYLYAWREDPRHLRGFVPARTASLDLAFAGDALVATDWTDLASLRADPAGESVHALLPRGRYVRPGEDLTIPLVNPGAVTLHVDLTLSPASRSLPSVTLAPGATTTVRIPSALLAQGREMVALQARSREASAGSEGARTALRVASSDDPAPPIGAAFPSLESERGQAPVTLPLTGRRQVIVFNNDTCVALWPELQDLAWLARHPMNPEGPSVMLVTNANPDFIAHWRLEALATLVRSDSYTLHEGHFRVEGIPGAWHTEYFVDERGVVREVERVYTGPASPVGGFSALGAP